MKKSFLRTVKRTVCVILLIMTVLFSSQLIRLSGNIPSDAFSVTAGAVSYTGLCGDNLRWTFDKSNGKLKISGKGSMTDYSKYAVPWEKYNDLIKSVSISSGATSISSVAFSYCYKMTSISIPSTVTSIGKIAFAHCESLKTISLPKNLKSIGDLAFLACTNLETLTIPSLVKSIGNGIVAECPKIEKINVSADNKYFCADNNGVLFNKVKSVLMAFPNGSGIEKFTVPNGVKIISSFAFANAEKLIEINFPNTLTKIGNSAFEVCYALQKIKLPSEVIKIGSSVFYGCTGLSSAEINCKITEIPTETFFSCYSLKSIVIPNGVKTIARTAFWGCEGLSKITIPTSMSSIGDKAFERCSNLKYVTYNALKTDWNKIKIGKNNDDLTNAKLLYIKIIDDIEVTYHKTAVIKPKIKLKDGAKTVWSSSKPNIATVDENGKVYGVKCGTTEITLKATDANGNAVTETCIVKVDFSFWQELALFLFFGQIWI